MFQIQKGRDSLEDLGVDGRITLKWVLRKEENRIDRTELVKSRNWHQDVENTAVSFRVPEMAGNFFG
jgi:hypothetical protein